MKYQTREETEYQGVPSYSMDDTQPLTAAEPHHDNAKSQSEPHTRLKTLIAIAMGKSPDTGKRYQTQQFPVIISWMSAAAVLGLSAFIVAETAPSWLFGAAIFNMILAAAGILLTLGLDLRFPVPKSQSDPRPSTGSYIYIVVKGIVWSLAAAAIFIASTTYEPSHFSKRKGRGGGGGGRGSGSIGPATPQSAAIGCGFLDGLIVVCTLFYWKFPAKALFRRYSEHETRRMYSLLLASNGSNVEGGK
ncbi:hypothetical protein BJX63DRAFT_427436 [Aspergillus granulosus]|uniref:MARVEL domain-containing protein n=1 Tax=Aspergillus granulosus TaxID=176169 RepID=A0ABR4I2X7_9EURO